MKLKTILSLLLIGLTLVGCMQEPTPTNTLKNVELNINEKGDVQLKKTYSSSDGNISITNEQISDSSQNVNEKPYELVPSFDKKYKSNIALGKKEIRIKKIKTKGKALKVSVEEIPLNEFIDLIFSNILKLNYTVSKDVRALTTPVTLNMTNLQPKQEVLDVVIKLLSMNGVSTRKENGVIFLGKKDSSKVGVSSDPLYMGYGRTVRRSIPDDETIVMFIPFKYIEPRKAMYIIEQAGISNRPKYSVNKSLQMFKSKAGVMRATLKVLNLIDRPYMTKKETYLINLNNIEVKNFLVRIKTILTSNGINTVSSPYENGVLLNPLPELNALYVISSQKSYIDMILYWKDKLDIPSEITKEAKFYTYKVKNRKADELAKILSSVVTIKLDTLSDTNVTTVSNSSHAIIADLPTNTLMMQFYPQEYREILPIIEELDALPLQVLVEVTVAEVTLTDGFSLGFEYGIKNDAAAALGSTVVDNIATASLGGSGFAGSFISNNLEVAIDAYAENDLLSILSKPKILILNNETGNINVGTQIPIVTSESSATDVGTGADPSILRNISYRDTGIVVGVTPTINSNGILTMSVELQLSEAQQNDTSGIDSPIIVNRALSTSLTLKHNETILLGGLISKNESTTDTGVPILMDIPYLGTFFKSQSKKIVKTELIMLIKPSIIQSPHQMLQETKKFRSMLKVLNKYSSY